MVLNAFKIIGARFSKSDADLLKKICNARGEDVSDFVRRSVRKELARLNYLSEEDKKALEIKGALLNLDIFEEIVGTLKSVKKENGLIILNFEIYREIRFPLDFDFLKEIAAYKGKKIAIIKTGFPEKSFRIREL